jgi:hypothetical protein
VSWSLRISRIVFGYIHFLTKMTSCLNISHYD